MLLTSFDLVCFRHSFDDLKTDLAHDFTVHHTSEVRGKDILEAVVLISHFTEDILVQNVGHDVGFQSPRIYDPFVVLADVFEHIFDAVSDFEEIADL